MNYFLNFSGLGLSTSVSFWILFIPSIVPRYLDASQITYGLKTVGKKYHNEEKFWYAIALSALSASPRVESKQKMTIRHNVSYKYDKIR